jgi:hypothetical protein
VVGIESFTVKTSLPEDGTGKKPLLIFPDLHLYVETEKADGFREWFEDFVIAGHNDDDKERPGAIVYQDPMLGDPIANLGLVHVGIYRISDEPPPKSGPPRTRVDLYCERMELSSQESASAGTTQPLAPVQA